jgi:putative NIF3 family GTP cyclohydrolase 1 type 2
VPKTVWCAVSTGTGVATNPIKSQQLGADVAVLTGDYYQHVRMGAHAQEMDIPTIIMDHGVTEAWGIENLARYVQQEFPELEVIHIPYRCGYNVIVNSPAQP